MVPKEICIRYYHIITVRAQDKVDNENFMFETPTWRGKYRIISVSINLWQTMFLHWNEGLLLNIPKYLAGLEQEHAGYSRHSEFLWNYVRISIIKLWDNLGLYLSNAQLMICLFFLAHPVTVDGFTSLLWHSLLV